MCRKSLFYLQDAHYERLAEADEDKARCMSCSKILTTFYPRTAIFWPNSECAENSYLTFQNQF